MPDIESHRQIQAIAKTVHERLGETITAADTERTIVGHCVDLLAAHGLTETWYHNCPATVLLGSRSCLSVSGRDYQPADEAVGDVNLVTVDITPSRGNVWGDCARSFYVEGGRCVDAPKRPEFVAGAAAQREFHEAVMSFVTPATTFHELFTFAKTRIEALGFENLDFHGNVGHSIESHLDERRYIEEGNTQRLSERGLFTFEPHIREVGGTWGFKHEDIYYFNNDKLKRL